MLKTRVFKIAAERGMGMSELALAMSIHRSMLYRVKDGNRGVNDAFIEGAKRAFPGLSLDELFVVEDEPEPASVA